MNLTEKYLGLEQTEQDVWRSFFEGLIIDSFNFTIDENFNPLDSEIVKETEFYILKKEIYEGETQETFEMESAYSVIDGSYIGDLEVAKFLEEKGIVAQAIKGNRVASIGYSEKDEKWYGWSHRAIYGFKEGMKVKKGDIAYVAKNEEDYLNELINFLCDGENNKVTKSHINVKDPNGDFEGLGVYFEYEYFDVEKNIVKSSHFAPYPETFGKGEYIINNKDEAKETAIAFANSVS